MRDKNETCQATTGFALPPYDIIADYVDRIDRIRRVTADEGMCGVGTVLKLDEVAIPEDAYFGRAFRTLVRYSSLSRCPLLTVLGYSIL